MNLISLLAGYLVVSLIASLTVIAVCIAAARHTTTQEKEEAYDQHLAAVRRLYYKYDDRLSEKLAALK